MTSTASFNFPVKPVLPANLSAEDTSKLEADLAGLIAGVTAVTAQEQTQSPGKWQLTSNGKAIERAFKFKTFKTTWDFMTAIATQCKKARHHPEWSNVYNTTFIRWTTHSSDSLSAADITMARFCDETAAQMGEMPAVSGPESGSASTGSESKSEAKAQSTEQSLVDTVAAVGAGCCVPGKACAVPDTATKTESGGQSTSSST